VTIRDVARVLGVTERTVRRSIERGALIAVEEPIPGGFRWRVLGRAPKDYLYPKERG